MCVTELAFLSVDLRKQIASMYLLESYFLDFVEPPSQHALNRNSTDIGDPPVDSLVSESTSKLR